MLTHLKKLFNYALYCPILCLTGICPHLKTLNSNLLIFLTEVVIWFWCIIEVIKLQIWSLLKFKLRKKQIRSNPTEPQTSYALCGLTSSRVTFYRVTWDSWARLNPILIFTICHYSNNMSLSERTCHNICHYM